MAWLARAVVLLLCAGAARAEEAKPFLPQKPSYQVIVLGDSLAAGLWSGLARMAESDLRLSVDGRYKEDSGLARPEFYDWGAALPKILAANPADIAVILVGSNDPQSIREGDARHAFGSRDWTRLYEARVEGLVAMLRQKDVAVYWVSLPPMAPEKYNESIRKIAAIQKATALAAGARHVDIRAALSMADGRFTDRGLDESGADRRLRAKDGVHFMKAGNNRIGSIVLAAIRADIDAADGAVPAALSQAPSGGGPVFGQEAASGAQNIVRAEALKPEAAQRGAGNIASAPLKPAAGSAAAVLFSTGAPPPAPKGRFDDFSAGLAP
jgi:uncharacterized protein